MLKPMPSKFLTLGLLLLALTLVACGSKEVTPFTRYTPTIATRDQISDPATVARQAFDVTAGGGVVHTVWEEARTPGGNVFDIWYSEAAVTATAGTFTNNAERITDTMVDSRNPRIAKGANGDVIVVWEEGTNPQREIAFTRRSGGVFAPISTLTVPADNEDDASPDVYIDASNRAHYVWVTGGKVIYRQQQANSAFVAAKILPDTDSSGTATNPGHPSVVADSGNNVMVAWEALQFLTTSQGNGNFNVIRVAASTNAGTDFNLAGRAGGTTLAQGASRPTIGLAANSGGFYLAFLIGKPGGSDFRVRVQHLTNFGAQNLPDFLDLYTSSTVPANSVDLSTIGDDVFVAWEVGGEAFVAISVDDLKSSGAAVKIADGNGTAAMQARPRVAAVGNTMVTVVDAATAAERAGFLAISDTTDRNLGN